MELEREIRSWHGNVGDYVNKSDLVLVLLLLIDRIEKLESALASIQQHHCGRDME